MAAFAGDAPYVGKWKENLAKSDYRETTVTYEQLPSGEMKETDEGRSYTFRVDGKEYTDQWGWKAVWKANGSNSWTCDWSVNGKHQSTDTLTLSADGKALTILSKGKNQNNEPWETTIVMDRVSGSAGLAGKWKYKNSKTTSPAFMVLSANGPDGLKWEFPNDHSVCDIKLDGKPYPCTSPTMAKPIQIEVSKVDDRTLNLKFLMDGQLGFQATYTVSADGKTLTESGVSTGSGENVKIVYERQ